MLILNIEVSVCTNNPSNSNSQASDCSKAFFYTLDFMVYCKEEIPDMGVADKGGPSTSGSNLLFTTGSESGESWFKQVDVNNNCLFNTELKNNRIVLL